MTTTVAALYDIHGNLPALEAVLDELRRDPVDRIVVGGDVFPGPMSLDVLERLRRLDLPTTFIHGNGETAVLDERGGRTPAVPEQVRNLIRWSAAAIADEAATFLTGWPLTMTIEIEGVGPVLFCHATPRDDNEIFTVATSDARVAAILENVATAIVVCGHTHMQFDRTVSGVRIVNAGSVGMPFGEAGAYWLRLGPGVELRRTEYDLQAAAARIRNSHYPDAENFATRYVLARPSAEEMVTLFTQYSMK